MKMGRNIKMISLFAGIGGFDLAADTLGWEILFQSEIDPFCLEVLKKHFPNIPKSVSYTHLTLPTICSV